MSLVSDTPTEAGSPEHLLPAMSGPWCSPDQESPTTQAVATAAPSVVKALESRYETKANGEEKPQLVPLLEAVLSGGRPRHSLQWLADDQPEGPQ